MSPYIKDLAERVIVTFVQAFLAVFVVTDVSSAKAGAVAGAASGEESGEHVALRARRLGLDTRALQLMAEINLERILSTLQAEQPQVAVIDSIQTLWSDELSSAPGARPGTRIKRPAAV